MLKFIQYRTLFLPVNRLISLREDPKDDKKVILYYNDYKNFLSVSEVNCPQSVVCAFRIYFNEFLRSDEIVFDLESHIIAEDKEKD